MESAVFYLNSEELDANFIKGVKNFFKNRHLKVTVTVADTNGSADAELLKLIERGEKADFAFTIPNDEFDELTEKFIENSDFDIVNAIKDYKVSL